MAKPSKATIWALLVLYIFAASLILLALSNPLVWALVFSLSLLLAAYLFIEKEVGKKAPAATPTTPAPS